MAQFTNLAMFMMVFMLIAIIAWQGIYKKSPKVKKKKRDQNDDSDIAFILDFLARSIRNLTRPDHIQLNNEKAKTDKTETLEESAVNAYYNGFKAGMKKANRSNASDEGIIDGIDTYHQYYRYWHGVPNNLRSVFFDRHIDIDDKGKKEGD